MPRILLEISEVLDHLGGKMILTWQEDYLVNKECRILNHPSQISVTVNDTRRITEEIRYLGGEHRDSLIRIYHPQLNWTNGS